MQKCLIFLCVIMFQLFSLSASAESPAAFVGRWVGYGYGCYDHAGRGIYIPREIIDISYKKNRLSARKVTGDDCVTTSNITWYFDVPANIVLGKNYTAIFQTGLPNNPNSGWVKSSIQFLSLDEIISISPTPDEHLTFIRQ